MASTHFTTGTTITSEWLNDVNDAVYEGNITAEGVQYTPPFTGGVTETVEDKLAQIINVQDFGADNTGTTDSVSAFTDALAAASSSNATIVASGTFKFDSGITIPTGTALVFEPNSTINFTAATGNLFTVERGVSLLGNGSQINFTNGTNLGAAIYLNGQQWFREPYRTTISGFTISSVSASGGIGVLFDTTLAAIEPNCAVSFVRMSDMTFTTLYIGLFLSSANLITQYINGNFFENFVFNQCQRPVYASATAPSTIQGNSFTNFQIQSYYAATVPAVNCTGASYNYFNNLQIWDWVGVGNPISLAAGGNNYVQTNIPYTQIDYATTQLVYDMNGNVIIPSNTNPIGFNYGKQRFGSATVAYNPDERITVASNVVGIGMNIQGGGSSLGIGMYGGGATGATDANAITFQNSSSVVVGSIKFNGTTTTYATSSDYRLKDNVKPLTGQLDRIMQLKPVEFDWKNQGTKGEGFIAHELQQVFPVAVTGQKDAVCLTAIRDENGIVVGEEEKPEYQGIDTSHLIGSLVAAIQELKAEFDEYKRINHG